MTDPELSLSLGRFCPNQFALLIPCAWAPVKKLCILCVLTSTENTSNSRPTIDGPELSFYQSGLNFAAPGAIVVLSEQGTDGSDDGATALSLVDQPLTTAQFDVLWAQRTAAASRSTGGDDQR